MTQLLAEMGQGGSSTGFGTLACPCQVSKWRFSAVMSTRLPIHCSKAGLILGVLEMRADPAPALLAGLEPAAEGK